MRWNSIWVVCTIPGHAVVHGTRTSGVGPLIVVHATVALVHFVTLSILSWVLIRWLLTISHVLWIPALRLLTISHVIWRHTSAGDHWMGGLVMWGMASIVWRTLPWISSTSLLSVTFIHAILSSHGHLSLVAHWRRSAVLAHLTVRILPVLAHSIRWRLTGHSWWTTHVRHHWWHTSLVAVLTSSTTAAHASIILLRFLTLIPCPLRRVVHLDWSSKNLFTLHLLQGAFRIFFKTKFNKSISFWNSSYRITNNLGLENWWINSLESL